jgi:peptidoglycan/xylan/chitin deacetylase (PgdA/CDA1 family)
MSVLSPSQQRMVMAEGLDVLERVTGDRPVGFRAPSGQFTDATPSLLRDFGVTYDSSLLGDDVQAHWLRDGDRHPTFGPYTFGRDLDIVELPWGRVMSDVPHFGHGPGADGSGTASATQVHDIWWEEFDYFRRHGEGGCLQFVLHPGLIGRGPRIEMLDRLIGAMTRRGAVFTTLRDAAEHARCSLPSGR